MKRLGLVERINHVIDRAVMIPAVGQGALGLECRTQDSEVREILAHLNDSESFISVTAERAMLRALRAGCLAPVGAFAEIVEERLQLQGVVLSGTGNQRVDAESEVVLSQLSESQQVDAADELGGAVAENLIAQGATGLIAEARDST